MLEAALGFTAKALITTVVLFIIYLVAERLGLFMVSVLLNLPMSAVPGYFSFKFKTFLKNKLKKTMLNKQELKQAQ